MAKTNITQYDSTPSNNADINSINIAENCPASNINNAIRELMAHLKNMDTGSQALTSPSFTAMSTDTINEKTSTNGVAIDSVTLKDGELGTTASPVPINSSSLNGGQFGGRRNLVINGAMQVAQRATSATGLGGDAFTYNTVDRFKNVMFGSTAGRFTQTQESITDLAGFGKCLKFACTTADTSIGADEILQVGQYFEGQDVQQLKKGTSDAEKVTASFYVKGNANATYTCELEDADNTRYNAQTFAVTTSWNRIVLTFDADTTGTLDSDNANSLRLNIFLHAGSTYNGGTFSSNTWQTTNNQRASSSQTSFYDSTSRTFFITGVQLELGSVATPFEHLSFSETLNLCQRFFQKSYNYGDAIGNTSNSNGSNAFQIDDGAIQRDGVRLVKSMRANPTIVIYNPVTGSSASVRTNAGGNHSASSFSQGENGFFVDYTPNTGEFLQFHHTADAEL